MTSPAALVNLLSRLRARREDTEKTLAQIDEDLRAVERTLSLLSMEENDMPGESALLPHYRPEDFAGMSQIEAIVALAERTNGEVTISEAKRMLVEARLTQSHKSASQIATGTIIRSRRFQWIAPATYRLLPQSPANGHDVEQPKLIKVG